MRRDKKREASIQRVLDEWNKIRGQAKADLMLSHPDLYWALAWLEAGDQAEREVAARMRRSRKW